MLNVLGVCDSHEANACLFVGGTLVAAVAEERLSRRKMDMGYPRRAIEFCLKQGGLSGSELDAVVLVSQNDLPEQYMVNRISTFSVADFVREQHEYWKPRLLDAGRPDYLEVFADKLTGDSYDYSAFRGEPLPDDIRRERHRRIRVSTLAQHLGVDHARIHVVPHERAHAFYGLYASPLRERTVVLTAEGMGDYSNSTTSLFDGQSLTELEHTTHNRLGHLWKFITLLLGMKPSQHEYKVMGLAPYANAKEVAKAYKVFRSLMKVDGLLVVENQRPPDYYFWFRDQLEGCRFDGIAGALQQVTEELMTEWVASCCRRLDSDAVVISGGVAQNIKAMHAIGALPEVRRLHVAPSSGDGSLAIGGAYLYLDQEYGRRGIDKRRIEPLSSVYLGPEYSTEDVRAAIAASGVTERHGVVAATGAGAVADHLAADRVVARFSGRMEFGQRALGNRSILASPRDPRMIRKVNSQIKFRDFWMPFTPTLLAEYAPKYLVNPKALQSPFMTLAFDTTALFQEHAPAAIHPADDTARPQVLERAANPAYYEVIAEFERRTGIGAVMNTSMNLHGDPMVCSPSDAIHMFEHSGLDVLAFDDALIVRQ